MSDLILRELTAADAAAFASGMQEWVGESPHWYSFAWKEGMTYSQMLAILEDERLGRNLAPNRVPHTMLYGFLGEQIIGRVSIRHSLNEYLSQRGGHIGYAVAPRFRRNGYAEKMVEQGLDYCRQLGLEKILVTCSDNNIPSWKLIEKFQGKLENKIWDDIDKENIRRYWIAL